MLRVPPSPSIIEVFPSRTIALTSLRSPRRCPIFLNTSTTLLTPSLCWETSESNSILGQSLTGAKATWSLILKALILKVSTSYKNIYKTSTAVSKVKPENENDAQIVWSGDMKQGAKTRSSPEQKQGAHLSKVVREGGKRGNQDPINEQGALSRLFLFIVSSNLYFKRNTTCQLFIVETW